jgi:3-dehydroquinate synthase
MNDRNKVETLHQQIDVRFDYPVHFTRGIFEPGSPVFAEALRRCGDRPPYRMLVYIDQGVLDAHPQLVQRIRKYVDGQTDLELLQEPSAVPGGERAKNGWNIVQNIMTDIGNAHLDRHNFVVAIGGGSVLDSVGFAASVVHRGVRLVRCPTTVLAQNDAGIGVKNGMDEHGMKNFVGTFAPPYAVISDFDFLDTLSDKYWTGGIAEAYKVAIIKDRELFEFLDAHAERLASRDTAAMEHVIKETARLHLDHIRNGGDPFEMGTARPLDFGHWSAHKLEVLSNYRLGHGQAVAIGIALDTCYALRLGLIDDALCNRILSAMMRTGLPVWDETLLAREGHGGHALLDGLEAFREHLGGELTITLPEGLGDRVEIHEMPHEDVLSALEDLRTRMLAMPNVPAVEERSPRVTS